MKRQKKIEIFASSDTEIVEMAALFFELDKYYEDVQLSFWSVTLTPLEIVDYGKGSTSIKNQEI